MTHLRGYAFVLPLVLVLLAVLPSAARADDAQIVVQRSHGAPHVVTVPATREDRTLASLNADPAVRYAAPNVTLHAAATTRDYFGFEWGLSNNGPVGFIPNAVKDSDIDAPEAWSVADGTGVKVAVVDTLVNTAHPDLEQNIAPGEPADEIPSGEGCDRPAPSPDHGTHVAGIVAAARGGGIVGVAPAAQIVPVRALDNCGDGKLSWILAAFDDAADEAQVVVASFATDPGVSPIDGKALNDAFAEVMSRHPEVLFVTAAGNEGNDNDQRPVYPCNTTPADNLLCVGASDADDGPACDSNYGQDSVDLFAPGQQIWSTQGSAGYGSLSGTSMAAPMVAGAAALVESDPALADPETSSFSGRAVAGMLRGGVDPKTAMRTLSVVGGRLNAYRPLGPDPQRLGSGGGDPAFPCDRDHDGTRDALDDCPDSPGPSAYHGCPDTDGDSALDRSDNCPAVANPTQADMDHDGIGDACDDSDGDGRMDAADACPAQYAQTSDGCPVPVTPGTPPPPPAVTPPPPAVAPAPIVTPTPIYMPTPPARVVSLSVKARKGTARVAVRLSRSATVSVGVERRVRSHGHWRWRRVTVRTLAGTSRSLTLHRLGKGSYRVSAVLSGTTIRRSFRV